VTIALFLDGEFRTAQMWIDAFALALPGEPVVLAGQIDDPASVDVALVRGVDPGNLTAFPSLGLVQCMWAGVDRLVNDPGIPTGPLLARTVDPAMADQMAATAVGHVLDVALGHHTYRQRQAESSWAPRHCKPMSTRTVGILGFGALGRVCAERLAPFGFRLIALKMRPGSPVTGVRITTSLPDVLHASDIVVNLLPLTAETENIFDVGAFGVMKPGAALINLARGRHIVDDDLIAALDSGQIARAVLDVFRDEPLPVGHPFWTHPQVTVTPHVAADTDQGTAAPILAANIAAFRRGDLAAITGLVDRSKGY
jgi:glyoxylate/hydroxypyruvate reductase